MSPKTKLHPRNQHGEGYDFARLVAQTPALGHVMVKNPKGEATIDFKDAQSVRLLNQALLKAHYGIAHWDIPANYLCPPIPGRVDYIHYLADLLAGGKSKPAPTGRQVRVLDIGTGASLVYPLTGQAEYGWHFTGVDIDAGALASAKKICDVNELDIELRRQHRPDDIFRGVIDPHDKFHVTMCNPPFHASLEQANKGTLRKWSNLGKGRSLSRNFGGQNAELWCAGGEIGFLARMVEQSRDFGGQCLWFTSLVSKKDNLAPLERFLARARVVDFKVVEMAQGQKTSRFVAWTYLMKTKREKFMQSVDS